MNIQQDYYRKIYDGVLIDTNLLLLVLVGTFDVGSIIKFKRTSMYDEDDYKNLISIIVNNNNRIFTTPQILTEIANLTDNQHLNKGNIFSEFFADFINKFVEIVYSSQVIVRRNRNAFIRLGLTDASIINTASENILTITGDLDLANLLSANSKPVINYNYIKY